MFVQSVWLITMTSPTSLQRFLDFPYRFAVHSWVRRRSLLSLCQRRILVDFGTRMLGQSEETQESDPRPTLTVQKSQGKPGTGWMFFFSKPVHVNTWGFPKMVGFPNKPMGFPTKNDHFGVF